MKKEEKYQIQRGDNFMYQGEVVKVVGYNPYNETDCSVVNKNGSRFYAEVEELEPIVINEYTLVQFGFKKITEGRIDPIYKLDELCVHYHTPICKAEIDEYYINSISTFGLPIGEIRMKIKHFHILQNALRLLGEEVELK